MQVRFILISIFFILSFKSYASAIDSTGVENNHGKQVILHKVEPKETYYSLGRKYHVSPKDIMKFNNNKYMQIGVIIKVPTNRPFTEAASGKPLAAGLKGLVDYKVGPKETLYAIARRFNTNIETIKQLNNLQDNDLTVGEIIKVKPGATSIPIPPRPVFPADADSTNADTAENRFPPNRYGLTEMSEHGVAVWIDDENLDSTKMLALHRTAPVGTIIRITNPMTDKTTFAKVVGKFAENETTRDVIIVVTRATANLLGAIDKRFQVNIDYGVPNE